MLMTTLALVRSALAKHTSCRWPTEKCRPRSPTSASRPPAEKNFREVTWNYWSLVERKRKWKTWTYRVLLQLGGGDNALKLSIAQRRYTEKKNPRRLFNSDWTRGCEIIHYRYNNGEPMIFNSKFPNTFSEDGLAFLIFLSIFQTLRQFPKMPRTRWKTFRRLPTAFVGFRYNVKYKTSLALGFKQLPLIV